MRYVGFVSWRCFVLAFIVLGVMLPCQATAQDAEMWRATLKGLNAVAVQVTPLGYAAEDAGLNLSTIRTDTELQLRKAGITILDTHKSSTPFLSVNVACVP